MIQGCFEVMNWAAAAAAARLSELYKKGEECEEEAEVVQSKRRRGYVKVNMDGVVVGRKVCIFEHGYYSSLALQLEDMFGMYGYVSKFTEIVHRLDKLDKLLMGMFHIVLSGRQCEFGLKLFETESKFSRSTKMEMRIGRVSVTFHGSKFLSCHYQSYIC